MFSADLRSRSRLEDQIRSIIVALPMRIVAASAAG
jgi:hypothetical protein